MKQAFADLREFHRVFGAAMQDKPGTIDDTTFNLRVRLIREEIDELFTAMTANDLVEIADACADLCYVVIGTAVAYGIPLDKVWEEVHRSNMAKAPGGVVTKRDDGKVMKPNGWTPPNIRQIIEDAYRDDLRTRLSLRHRDR